MAKKIFKGILGIGGKKKKAAEPVEGQPIITQLSPEATQKGRRLPPRSRLGGTIFGDLTNTLGG